MELVNVVDYTDDALQKDSEIFITKLPQKRLPKRQREQVLAYLQNKAFQSPFCVFEWGTPDPFTGTPMKDTGASFSDGKYLWNDKLFFYVRDHNIELSDVFLEHVKTFFENGGSCTPVIDV